MSESALTPDDYRKLRDLSESGAWKYAVHGDPESPDPDDGTPLEAAHRGGDGRRGITLEMCNAIRAAADDGKTYRQIAGLFGFFSDPKTAHLHATGRCVHGRGGYPPVPPKREPGPTNPIDERECRDLRTRYRSGETVPSLAEDTGRAQSAVYRHVSRGCSHE